MLDVFAHFPGVEVNGLTMSRKAVEKVARRAASPEPLRHQRSRNRPRSGHTRPWRAASDQARARQRGAYAVLALVVGFRYRRRDQPGQHPHPTRRARRTQSRRQPPRRPRLTPADQEALEDRARRPSCSAHGQPDGTLTQTSATRAFPGLRPRVERDAKTTGDPRRLAWRTTSSGSGSPAAHTELVMIADYINSASSMAALTFVPSAWPTVRVPARGRSPTPPLPSRCSPRSITRPATRWRSRPRRLADPVRPPRHHRRPRRRCRAGPHPSTNGPTFESIPPTGEQAQRYLGRLACTTLRTTPSAFSEQYDGDARRFAILTPGSRSMLCAAVDTGVLESTLRDCGADFQRFEFSNVSGDPAQTSRDQAMYQQMGKDGFTTVPFRRARLRQRDQRCRDMQSAGYPPELVTVERSDSF